MAKLTYRPEIDGLRAIAVVPVIFFHAGFPAFAGGFVGVDIFFVISGYLITTIIAAELEAKRFSIVDFYDRRARRILPALFFVILCCLPFAWAWMTPADFEQFGLDLVAVVFFVANIRLALDWDGYFGAEAEEKPLLHTWSLAVEEQYYIFFPLAMMLIWRFGRRPVFWIVFAAALLSLAAAEIGWRRLSVWNFYLLPTRAWELLAGALCALAMMHRPPRGNDAAALAGVAMILASIALFDAGTPFPSLWALLPVGGTCLVVLFARAGTLTARAIANPVFVGIGLVSYSAYLWHQPLFAFARIRALEHPGPATFLVLTALSFALAVFTWRVIEQPFRGRAPITARAPRTAIAAAVGIAAGFVGFGLYAERTEGAVSRFPAETARLLDEGAWSRRCLREPGDPWEACVFETGETGPRVALFGDSIASAVAPALIDALHDRAAAEVHQFTHTHCLPMQRTITAWPPDNPCTDYVDAVIARINALEPAAVVVAANWSVLDDPGGLLHAGALLPDTEARLRTLTADLSDTLARIEAPVILLLPYPRAGDRDVLRDAFRHKLATGDFLDSSTVPYTQFRNQFEDAFAILQGVTAPNVRFVRTDPALCDGQDCHLIEARRLLLSDAIHLTRHGADRVVALPGLQNTLGMIVN